MPGKFPMRSEAFITVIACGLLTASGLQATQRFFVEEQVLSANTTGRVPIRFESDIEIQGLSIAIDYDDALLDVTDIRTVGPFVDADFQDHGDDDRFSRRAVFG